MRKLLLSPLKKLLRNPSNTPAARQLLARSTTTSSSSSSSSAPPEGPHRLFRSWKRSGGAHRGPPEAGSSALGLLAFRFLSNEALGPSGGRLERLVESGVRSLKVSLQRKPFGRRMFGSPQSSWRYMMLTPDGIVLSLIGANIAVYMLWRIADPTFMRKHFMISLDNFKSGRLHTLITSAFSHQALDHLATNMIGLYFFGTSIARLFGAEFLLKLYFAGALGGSIFFLVHKFWIAPSSKGMPRFDYFDYSRVPGLGASAAVNAIILLDVFLFPKNIYYVNLVIPVPAIVMGAFIIGSDLWRVKKGEGEISGSAHLGGAAVAALAWAGIKRGWI